MFKPMTYNNCCENPISVLPDLQFDVDDVVQIYKPQFGGWTNGLVKKIINENTVVITLLNDDIVVINDKTLIRRTIKTDRFRGVFGLREACIS